MNQAEDVEVILAHDRRYKFHSGTLARNSTFFADLLIEPLAAKLSSKAKNAGIKIKWMVELTGMPTDQRPAGVLELVEVTPNGERAPHAPRLVLNENGKIPTKILDHYESVFYAFYNRDIRISGSDMNTVLNHCVSLIDIAEYLGCISLISKAIEVALVKHGQGLFCHIQKMPHIWINMGFCIKSELIFREAMIHLTGNWRRFKREPAVMDRLKEVPAVRSLIEKHHREMVKKCKKLEVAVMSLYPGGMCTPSNDLPIKREEYSKDILVWMALTFFRHWLGQRIITDKGCNSLDGGYELYTQLSQAGSAYMDKAVINQFHTKFPMTKKAINVLENHLLEIKECMKGVISAHKILNSHCQLDTHRFPVDYLTCVEFDSKDLPWAVEEEMETVTESGKRKWTGSGNEIARRNLEVMRRHKERGTSTEEEREDEDEDMVVEEATATVANKRFRYE